MPSLFLARRQKFFEPQSSMERMGQASPIYLSRLSIFNPSLYRFMTQIVRALDGTHFVSVGHKMTLQSLISNLSLMASSIVT